MKGHHLPLLRRYILAQAQQRAKEQRLVHVRLHATQPPQLIFPPFLANKPRRPTELSACRYWNDDRRLLTVLWILCMSVGHLWRVHIRLLNIA